MYMCSLRCLCSDRWTCCVTLIMVGSRVCDYESLHSRVKLNALTQSGHDRIRP